MREELGEQVLVAIENEDVLGILDMLMPGEREVFKQPAIDFVSELSRLEVLSPDADLAEIEGIDLSITDGAVEAVETNVADITNLELTGEITAEVDGEALPDRRPDPRLRRRPESTSPSSTTAPAPSSTSRSRPSRSTVGGTSACSSPPPRQARSSARAGRRTSPQTGIEPSGGAEPRGRAR